MLACVAPRMNKIPLDVSVETPELQQADCLLHRSEAQRRAQILRLNFALPPGKAVEGVVTLNPLNVYRESASYLALGAVQENPHKQDSVAS